MKNHLKFSDFLKNVFSNFDKKVGNSGLVSFCVELPNIDLYNIYQIFLNKYTFSSFWEESNGVSYIALEKCKYITLEGPRKFELAKEFNSENFKNLIELTEQSDQASITRIIYLFSFSENLKKRFSNIDVPSLEAVLPKILIIKKNNKCWLRINGHVQSKSSLRTLLEEFWLIKNQILDSKNQIVKNNINDNSNNNFLNALETSNSNLKNLIRKGIQIVEEDLLEKIVLAHRVKLKVKSNFDLIRILKRLKTSQPNTYKYVWKRNSNDIIFGASPERLFVLKKPDLILEALAGTSSINMKIDALLKSKKDLKEHNFVIEYLVECLQCLDIDNYQKTNTKVKSFGDIAHLQTLVFSKVVNICPFELLQILHPSPAVCGTPKKEALEWINTLESFSRGNYASPMGWVDSLGNSEFLVTIRGARYIEKSLEFIAGCGIVKGSLMHKEINEIKLKLNSLVKQILSVQNVK
tara:strand:- start:122 stop:1519 length:1398 start_codon:yes stop_codon:yes gene_type:complete